MSESKSPGEPPVLPLLQHFSAPRLFTIVLVFLGLAGYAVWKSERFQGLLHGVSQARLSEALGVPVEFDTVGLRLLPPSVSLVHVRIGNDPKLALPADRPLLTAEEVSIAGGGSLSGGELRLGRIRALHPRLVLQQLPDGRWNLPPGLSGPSKGVKVKIGSLLVQEGLLDLEGRQIGIDGSLEEFAAELNATGPDQYHGVVVARRATLRLPAAEPIVAALGLRFEIDGRRGVTVDDLRLQGAFGTLVASGSLEDFAHPRAALLVSGEVSVQEIERIFRSELGFEGQASVRARLETPAEGGFRVTGTVAAPRARRPPFLLQDVEATVIARPEELVARIEHARYAGGEAQGTFRIADITTAQVPLTLNVEATGLSLERFFADLGLPGTGLSGSAALTAAMHWGKEGIERAIGGGRLDVKAGPATSIVPGRFGIPTEGGAPLAIVDGRIGFEGGTLRFPKSTLDFTGSIPIAGWQPDFDFRLQSKDFSEIDRVFQNFVAAGGDKPWALGLGGSGEVAGHVARSWSDPDVTAQIAAEDARYDGVLFGSARGTVDMSAGAFVFRPLRVYEGDATLALEGMIAYRTKPGRDPFDLTVSARHFPVSRLLAYLDLDLPIEGNLTGMFPLRGSRESLSGGGPAELEAAVLWKQPFERISGRAVLTPDHFALEDLRAPLGGGMIGGSGSWAIREKEFQARLAGDGVTLGALQPLGESRRDLDGKLSFQLSGSGTLEHPDLTVTASLSGASFFHHGIAAGGDPELSARVEKGRLEGALTVPNGFRLTAAGEVFRTGAPIDVSLDVASLPALLRFTPVEVAEGYGGSLALSGTVVLPSESGAFPTGTFRLARAVVDLPGRPAALRVEKEARFSSDGSRLAFEPFEVVGDGVALSVNGSFGLAEGHALDLSVSGPVDPAVLEAAFPGLGLSGSLKVALRAAGTISSPRFSGEIGIENGKYRVASLSQLVDQIEGTVRFEGGSGGALDARAKVGGGDVTATGSFSLEGFGLKDFRLTLAGRHILVRYPEDVRLQLDADLVLTGGPTGNLVRGEVVLLRGSYSRDFDVTLSDLLSKSRPTGVAAREPWKEKTRLEVHVVSSQSLEVRNNLALLTGTVDLLARGTLADPALIGQVVLDEGGRVTFRDVRYEIESGTVTFASTRGLVPIFDVRARAEVRDYNVTVNLAGAWPRVETTFSSDPPLSDEQIVNLLLTGTRPSTGIASDIGATLAGTAGSIVGSAATGVLTRPAQKLFKLDRFQIDPIITSSGLSGATTTVTKQINPDWSVTYSQPLFEAGIREPIVEVEGRISRTWVLRLRKDENGNYLVDLRRRTRE